PEQIAIPGRSTSSAPCERPYEQHDNDGGDEHEKCHDAPRIAPAAREDPRDDRHDTGEEIRDESKVAAKQEVFDVACESRRPFAARHHFDLNVTLSHDLTGLSVPHVARSIKGKRTVKRQPI